MVLCLTTIVALGVALAPIADAFPAFLTLIPNGDRIPHPCNRNRIWKAVGHENPEGGGTLNPFGNDFKSSNRTWTAALCRMDSDGDGLSNGEELGDPFCVWSVNATPAVLEPYQLSHPGICEPLGSYLCDGRNTFLTQFCPTEQLQLRGGVCDNVTTPDFGFIVQASIRQPNGKYASGDSIEFNCSPRYGLVGNAVLTCSDSGSWSSPPPTCHTRNVMPVSPTPTFCYAPPTPRNGYVSNRQPQQIFDRYGVGESLIFSCHDGYTISNRAPLQCLIDGTWSMAVPVCLQSFPMTANAISPCSVPTIPNNAKIQTQTRPNGDGRYVVGGYVMFGCQPGYASAGRATVQCQRDGTWTSTSFSCTPLAPTQGPPVTCTAPGTPNNSYIYASTPTPGSMNNAYHVDDFIQYACNDGFESDERPVIFCQNDGTFAPNVDLNCAVKIQLRSLTTGDCSAPSLANSNKLLQITSQRNYLVGDLIKYVCMGGYYTDDPLIIECYENGTWSFDLPYCIPIPDQSTVSPYEIDTGLVTCEPPLVPRHGIVVARSVSFSGLPYAANDWIQYACQDGFKMERDTHQLCNRDGYWTGTIKCLRVEEIERFYYYGRADIPWNSVRPPITGSLQRYDSSMALCGQPIYPKNGRIVRKEVPFNDDSAKLFPPGASFTFDCLPGFQMMGLSTVTCDEAGKWNKSPLCLTM